MNVKEFLSQLHFIDQRINCKFEQMQKLRALATKGSATLSDINISQSKKPQKMESTVLKIISLENEINKDINELIDLKQKISSMIKQVGNFECQVLLELRYLNLKTWAQIASEMGYSLQHIFKIHRKALKSIKIPES